MIGVAFKGSIGQNIRPIYPLKCNHKSHLDCGTDANLRWLHPTFVDSLLNFFYLLVEQKLSFLPFLHQLQEYNA